MTSKHNMFTKHTYMLQSTSSDIVMCQLGQVPLQFFWHGMTFQFVGRLVDLPDGTLV